MYVLFLKQVLQSVVWSEVGMRKSERNWSVPSGFKMVHDSTDGYNVSIEYCWLVMVGTTWVHNWLWSVLDGI